MKKYRKAETTKAIGKYVGMYAMFIVFICLYSAYKYGSFMHVDYDALIVATAVFIAGVIINETRRRMKGRKS